MKVKFNTSIVFTNGLSYSINQVAEVEEALGLSLIEDKIAVQVVDNMPTGTFIGDVNSLPVVEESTPAPAKPGKKPKKNAE
jgi:hypothetical protein